MDRYCNEGIVLAATADWCKWSIWSVRSIWCIRSKDETDEIDRIDQTDLFFFRRMTAGPAGHHHQGEDG